jgi:hypothetical protein
MSIVGSSWDLFDFINLASSSHLQDNTYSKINSNWSEFIDCPSSYYGKQLFSKIISKRYSKHHESIKVYKKSDYELTDGLLKSILIYQQIQFDE